MTWLCAIAPEALAQDAGVPAYETVVRSEDRHPGAGAPDEVITAAEIARSGATTVPELLVGWLGAALADEQGNGDQLDLAMRGFMASPVTGVSQGLAVYVDGVRVNEPGAGEVNFDL